MKIWALHGFLGLPSDFDSVKQACLNSRPNLEWESVDYLRTRELSPTNSLKEWGVHFNRRVRISGSSQNILIGYSQGGRLALQALQEDPSLWSMSFLISANPGIAPSEKPARLKNDQEWAQRFLNEDFKKTLEKWNAQSVFQGSQSEPARQESNYNRQQLADCLVRWSVAEQELFLPQVQTAVVYFAGELDAKYVSMGWKLQTQNPKILFEEINQSGHRILFDQPQKLAERILFYLPS